MKVAIVHDWLIGGGAERVVEELHNIFPEAPIYTSYATAEWRKRLNDKVITGYLQHPPFKQLRRLLPVIRQRWFRKLDLSEFDLVISSTGNGEAKFVTVRKPAIHISYCHSPTHFYWRHYNDYLRNPSARPKWLVRIALRTLVGPLRKRDFKAAQKVDFFVANSTHIQNDIQTFYGKPSVVIYPPVDTKRFNVKSSTRKGYVTAGRQVPHKRTEIIIEACNKLGLPLTVIGKGPEHKRLQNLAGPTIQLLEHVSDQEMPRHFASAEGFIFASFEDFGVTPVEALAAGTPVLADKAVGELDYVLPNKTGAFFDKQTSASIENALKSFRPGAFDEATIRSFADTFSTDNFQKHFKDYINRVINTE